MFKRKSKAVFLPLPKRKSHPITQEELADLAEEAAGKEEMYNPYDQDYDIEYGLSYWELFGD